MASENVWQKISRVYRAPRFLPSITIRQNGSLAVNADFVRMADIGECDRASIYVSKDGLQIAIEFHNDQMDDDAFLLSRDGGAGSASGQNRLITARSLLKQSPAVAAVAKGSQRSRRYTPRRDGNKWVIDLAPSFERRLSNIKPEAVDTGIYRYLTLNSVVYIGRGRILDRTKERSRDEWQFDAIEYSVINDETAERKWETFWLNEYRRVNGEWPLYNKIGGLSAKTG